MPSATINPALARWLTQLPPNKLDAQGYVSAAKQLSKQHGWKFEFLNEKKLTKLAGAILRHIFLIL